MPFEQTVSLRSGYHDTLITDKADITTNKHALFSVKPVAAEVTPDVKPITS